MDTEDRRKRQAATGEKQRNGNTGAMAVEKGPDTLSGIAAATSDVDNGDGFNARQPTNGLEELESNAKLEGDVLALVRRALWKQAEVLDAAENDCTDAPSMSSSSSPLPSAILSSLSISTSSPLLSLTPPLPSSVELDELLVDCRLVLDVYRGGGAVMPVLWESLREKMRQLQYIRLGSDDKEALESALGVLPRLIQLRSLAIRGTHTFIFTHSHIYLMSSSALLHILVVFLLLYI